MDSPWVSRAEVDALLFALLAPAPVQTLSHILSHCFLVSSLDCVLFIFLTHLAQNLLMVGEQYMLD